MLTIGQRLRSIRLSLDPQGEKEVTKRALGRCVGAVNRWGISEGCDDAPPHRLKRMLADVDYDADAERGAAG